MLPFDQNYPFPSFAKTSLSTLPFLQTFNNPFLCYDPTTIDFLSLMKFQNDLQSQLLTLQIMNRRTLETKYALSIPSKITSPVESMSPPTCQELKSTLELPNDPEICLEAQVKYMIQFFINNYGIASTKEIENARQNYVESPKLLKAFESLTLKYAATSKSREEMIKWIIRRVLKASKKAMKSIKKKDQKRLLKDICKKYFKENESPNQENDTDECWVDSILPFRKNSKNKTMNSNFIAEIFESDEFKKDYKGFLKEFDDVTEKENNEKIHRFTKLVLDCIKKGTFDNISKYKRIPWLRLWIKNTKKVAYELDEGNLDGKENKRIKIGC